jgi:hypothetical protein
LQTGRLNSRYSGPRGHGLTKEKKKKGEYSLVDDWEKVMPRPRVYLLGTADREIVNKTFDALHKEGKMPWATNHTRIEYPVFVAYRMVHDVRKGRVVVDIRGFISRPALRKLWSLSALFPVAVPVQERPLVDRITHPADQPLAMRISWPVTVPVVPLLPMGPGMFSPHSRYILPSCLLVVKKEQRFSRFEFKFC